MKKALKTTKKSIVEKVVNLSIQGVKQKDILSKVPHISESTLYKIKKANKSRIEIEKEKYLKLIDKITGGDKTQATILKGCLKAKTDIFNFKGEVVGRKPDYKTRLDTIKYIDKLKGREDIKKVINNNQQNNFVVEELNKFYK